MSKNNSPSSQKYQKQRMRERRAAGRVALPLLVANWPDVFGASLPFVDSMIDELYAASIAEGRNIPRGIIQLGIIEYMRRGGYKKRMKTAKALAGYGYIVPISAKERDQRYAVYKATFFNFTGKGSKPAAASKPIF